MEAVQRSVSQSKRGWHQNGEAMADRERGEQPMEVGEHSRESDLLRAARGDGKQERRSGSSSVTSGDG